MDHAPYDFILNHEEKDREKFLSFKHRTFQATDTLYFLTFFQDYYKNHPSLEHAFARHLAPGDTTTEKALIGFHHDFFDHPYAPDRTRKHVSTPERQASCKRLNMFLRWMVRSSAKGVDFGIWKNILPAHLICPCDVHVGKVAQKFKLIAREPNDWKTATELTKNLRTFDAEDPVKYDFALFGIGRYEM